MDRFVPNVMKMKYLTVQNVSVTLSVKTAAFIFALVYRRSSESLPFMHSAIFTVVKTLKPHPYRKLDKLR